MHRNVNNLFFKYKQHGQNAQKCEHFVLDRIKCAYFGHLVLSLFSNSNAVAQQLPGHQPNWLTQSYLPEEHLWTLPEKGISVTTHDWPPYQRKSSEPHLMIQGSSHHAWLTYLSEEELWTTPDDKGFQSPCMTAWPTCQRKSSQPWWVGTSVAPFHLFSHLFLAWTGGEKSPILLSCTMRVRLLDFGLTGGGAFSISQSVFIMKHFIFCRLFFSPFFVCWIFRFLSLWNFFFWMFLNADIFLSFFIFSRQYTTL